MTGKTKFLLAAAMSLGLFSAAAAEQAAILREDFSDNRRRWKEVEGLEDLRAVVENGKFTVRNNLMPTYIRQDGVLAGRKDFEIEAVFSGLKGDGDYGLKFDTVDQRNSYTFTVNGKGEYLLVSVIDGARLPAGQPQKTEHLRPGANKLGLRCDKGKLHLLVNGKETGVSDCFGAAWDRAGFIAGKVIVDVDDFAVFEPGAAAPEKKGPAPGAKKKKGGKKPARARKAPPAP